MGTKELHAYLQGPKVAAVIRWIEMLLPGAVRAEPVDLTREIGAAIMKFHGEHELLILERLMDYEWLELTIRPESTQSIFAEWNNIRLGERLVDDLGGITLVDCLGVYTHPLSDQYIRVSQDKMELVYLPATMDEPFDETLTQLIKRR
jgi:hypothetical protein